MTVKLLVKFSRLRTYTRSLEKEHKFGGIEKYFSMAAEVEFKGNLKNESAKVHLELKLIKKLRFK